MNVRSLSPFLLCLLGTLLTAPPARCAGAAVDDSALLRAWNGITGGAIAEHVRVLASDEFEGRAPGTIGETKTVAYLQSKFREAGLTPWQSSGYEQEVPLVQTTLTGRPRLELRLRRKRLTPLLRQEFVPRLARPTDRVAIHGSRLIFAGHGTVAPACSWDDYAGADLKGATVILLQGDADTGANDSARAASLAGIRRVPPVGKFEAAARLGARAAIVIHMEKTAGYPWTAVSKGGLGQSQYFLAPEVAVPELEAVVNISEPEARVLFAAAGLDFDREIGASMKRGFMPRTLQGTVDLDLEAKVVPIQSHNLIGLVPGSEVPNEAVLLMAHWDHMGRDTTLTGDQIFNGAVDNATGTGMLIEIARAFQAMPRAPRRTVIFVATTAEERGLLGSEYLARHPVKPLKSTVAAIALDAHFPYGPWERMAVTGFGGTELEEALATAAARLGRKLQGDGAPEQGAFNRADNYPFAKRGVPGFLAVGNPDTSRPATDPVVARLLDYVQTKYHHVTDEYDPATWNMEGIEGDARTLFEFSWRVAEDIRFPNWRWSSPYRALRDEPAGAADLANATPTPAKAAPADSTGAERMFQRMSALVGDWEGTYEWTGARKGSGDLKVTYSSTGFGSALLETLVQGGVPSMTTIYHLDGADLRMTHYCAARNQPRLKATRVDPATGAADFGFVDVTGSTAHGYVEGMELRILDPDRLHIRFRFGGGAPKSYEDITLKRIRPAVG